MKSRPERWNQYVYTKTGPLTKEQTAARYADPAKWIDRALRIPAPYTTFGGYEYLDPINAAQTAFHPGVDINDSYGDQDLGNPIQSPVNGEVVYMAKNDGGWGNHCFIYEDDLNEHPQVDIAFAESVKGRMFISVQEHGELWYVNLDGKRYYMGSSPAEIYEFVKSHASGITSADLKRIPKE